MSVSSELGVANDTKAAAAAKPEMKPPQMASMPSVAPLFLEGAGFSSVLHLVNETTLQLTAQVDLLSLDGRKAAGQSFKIAANGEQTILIKSILNAAGSGLDAGSVRVSSGNDGGLLAAMSLTHHGTTDTYFDEELAMPSMESSTALRGVSDSAMGSPIVALSSLASTAQHVTVNCLSEKGVPTSRVFDLEPNQTVLERPCDLGRQPSLLSAADISIQSPQEHQEGAGHGAVGISISSDGMPGELAAFGITPHSRRQQQFFTSLNFSDPKFRHSGSVVYTGIPVGPSPLLAEGSYSPELALTNFGAKAISVSVTSSTMFGSEPKTQTLALFSVAAGLSKTVKLDGMPESPDFRSSLIVESDAAPGDLGTKLVSRGAWRLPVVEMLEKEGTDAQNGGGHPWTTANGINSILLLFNHDSKERWFNVRFGLGKKPWMKRYKMASMETLAIGINDLIARQEKDDSGQKLSNKRAGTAGRCGARHGKKF
jgi:hypothetical protein